MRGAACVHWSTALLVVGVAAVAELYTKGGTIPYAREGGNVQSAAEI